METLIWIGLGVALAAIPGYVTYYVLHVVPTRREEILEILTARVAECYLRVFRPATTISSNHELQVLDRFEDFHRPSRYIRMGLFAFLPSAIGSTVVAAWIYAVGSGSTVGAAKIPTTAIFAFLGGWVWSLYEVIDRGTRRTLVPDTLADAAFRMLASVPIGYAFSLLVMQPVMPFIAFAISAFPMRDVRLFMNKKALEQLKHNAPAPAASQQERLQDRVPAIGIDALAQLREVGITTVTDLAYADPVRILVQTGLPLRRVIVWIDAALLALYAGANVEKLRAMGIGSALEASHFFKDYGSYEGPDGEHLIDSDKAEDQEVIQLCLSFGVSFRLLGLPVLQFDDDFLLQTVVDLFLADRLLFLGGERHHQLVEHQSGLSRVLSVWPGCTHWSVQHAVFLVLG